MNSDLNTIKSGLLSSIEAAATLEELETLRVNALGKKGTITSVLKSLGGLAPEERKELAQFANQVKEEVQAALDKKDSELSRQLIDRKLAEERIDITLPVRESSAGRIHPITHTIEELLGIFSEMGFTLAEGPDIETDWYNFTALNMPEEHPARQMHDTFYLNQEAGGPVRVLRTHTSSVQIRAMQKTGAPIRIIALGRTYRSDYDMTHTPMFHQIEGLLIDKHTHFGHLKGCLEEFLQRFFQIKDLPVRFRPSFFPFTEPSAEADIGCSRKDGELRIGAGESWLEILGCGMVHPNVLKSAGVDPEKYQGFAFGMGIERMVMLKYGIPDLRDFFSSDARWLRHYGFAPHDLPYMQTESQASAKEGGAR